MRAILLRVHMSQVFVFGEIDVTCVLLTMQVAPF